MLCIFQPFKVHFTIYILIEHHEHVQSKQLGRRGKLSKVLLSSAVVVFEMFFCSAKLVRFVYQTFINNIYVSFNTRKVHCKNVLPLFVAPPGWMVPVGFACTMLYGTNSPSPDLSPTGNLLRYQDCCRHVALVHFEGVGPDLQLMETKETCSSCHPLSLHPPHVISLITSSLSPPLLLPSVHSSSHLPSICWCPVRS